LQRRPDLHQASRIALPPSCAKALVLGPKDFARGGAAEVFADPKGGGSPGRNPSGVSGLERIQW